MIGFVYGIISAVLYGLLEGLKKKATSSFDVPTIFWALVTFAAPVFVVALFIEGIPDIQPLFWLIIAIDTPLLIFTNILLIKAEKISPISLTLPLLSLTPVFLIFTSFFMLGELPNAYGLVGILLVVLGALLLKGEDLRKGLKKEISGIFKNKGARYMLLIAFIWSFNANFSKIGIETSSLWMYVAVGTFVEAVFMNMWMWKKYGHTFLKKIKTHGGLNLFSAAAINGLAIFFYLAAIEHILVSYVITLKRAGFIAGALWLGATVFREKNVKYRIGGALLMLVGVIFILVLH